MISPIPTLALLAQTTVDNSGAGLFAGMGALIIVFVIIAAIGSIFWIWMLIDCLTSSLSSTEKLMWGLIIFFGHLLGAILYFAIARGGARRAAA